jgi:signal transduction histidine kinase/CheY-like chemotaxis protein
VTTHDQPSPHPERVLVLLPDDGDAQLADQVFREAGLPSERCADIDDLVTKMGAGAGAALLAEEALTQPVLQRLDEALGRQPPWCDFPLVIFFNRGGETTQTSRRMLAILEPLGNVTVLERPVRVMSLLSAVQAALRARRRQYQLRDLLAQQDEAVRHREEFLGLLAHELRNPLAAIQNATQILDQMGLLQGSLATQQRTVIERQTRVLARLIEDVQDVYQVASGKVVLQRQPTDLAEIARHGRDLVEPAAKAQRLQLHFSVSAEPILVEGDPARLRQIVTHLLRNAVQHTPPGGRICLTVGAENGHAVLRVRDTGRGIEPDRLAHLFDLFGRSRRPPERASGGLGIGLPMVRSLTEMHGGSVSAASAGPGQGSEFVIRLPLRAVGAAAPAAPAPAEAIPHPRRRVLIVEDNPDGRETLRLLLQLDGHQVEVAPDGPLGVKKALAWRPDVALIDIGLPGLDGYDVARQVRAALGNRVRLIALTGYGQPHDRRRALEAGFDLHLVKPVDPEMLRGLLVGTGNVPAHGVGVKTA